MTLLTEELAAVGAAQLQDVYSGNHPKPSTLAMIMSTYRYKTARYTFSLPLMLGLLAGGGPAATGTTLGTFGEHLGIIFQIRDDEIGLFGTEQNIGKPVGSDIREGKKTLYHHFLYRHATNAEKRHLNTLFGNPKLSVKDIKYVRELVLKYRIPERIERLVCKQAEHARAALATLSFSDEQTALFNDIMSFTEGRSS